MSRSLTVCRSALSVAAAVVLLTACTDSGEEDSAASTTSAATSSAQASATPSETAGAEDSEFCTAAAGIQERVGSTLNSQSDPASLPQALEEAAGEIRAIDAPEEITADWNALADGVDQIATAFSEIDMSDPNALANFQQQISQLEAGLADASANVENYLREECGFESTGTGGSSPTS